MTTDAQNLSRVNVGRFWFQNRSYSPIPLFLLMLVLRGEYTWATLPFILKAFGTVIGILSEGLRIYSVGFAGSATRTRGDSIPSLVCRGPYRWVRNPLYIANIAMYSACGLLMGHVFLALVMFVFASVQYFFIVRFEEDRLTFSFGESYRNYQSQVPRWLPSFTNKAPRSQHEFSLRSAVKSEKSTLILMLAMTFLILVKHY